MHFFQDNLLVNQLFTHKEGGFKKQIDLRNKIQADWIKTSGSAKEMIYKQDNVPVRYAFEMAEVHVISYLTLVKAISKGIFTFEESADRLKITDEQKEKLLKMNRPETLLKLQKSLLEIKKIDNLEECIALQDTLTNHYKELYMRKGKVEPKQN